MATFQDDQGKYVDRFVIYTFYIYRTYHAQHVKFEFKKQNEEGEEDGMKWKNACTAIQNAEKLCWQEAIYY